MFKNSFLIIIIIMILTISCGDSGNNSNQPSPYTHTNTTIAPQEITANGKVWKYSWSDEFDGNTLDTHLWNYRFGNGNNSVDQDVSGIGWGNFEKMYYTDDPKNIKVENGKLIITAIKEYKNGYNYTSARIETLDKNRTTENYAFTYGKVIARAKLSEGLGLWPAIWMLGSDRYDKNISWPECGEIDIVELNGKYPATVKGTVHGPISQSTGNGGSFSFADNINFSDDFHEFSIEWDKDELNFYVDNILYHTVKKSDHKIDWVFNHNFYFIINLAVGGGFLGNPNPFDFNFIKTTMEIDFIRIYKYLKDSK